MDSEKANNKRQMANPVVQNKKSLQYGVGFRREHYAYLQNNSPKEVDFFEIISENFMFSGGAPRFHLEKLRERYPVAMHGVGMSIAGMDELNTTYLKKLKSLMTQIQPDLVSDHLCWTSHGGHNTFDLLPVPFTTQKLSRVCERVDAVQEFLGRPLLLENPSAYVAFAIDEMNELDFLFELCTRTGCKVLLDINNLFVNWRNLGINPLPYFDKFKPDMIGQFHLAGHSIDGEVRIDTHDHPVCDEVWDLYRIAASRFPDVPTLVEWDVEIPPFEELMQECAKARKIKEHGGGERPSYSEPVNREQRKPGDLESTHATFIHLMTSPLLPPEDGASLQILARERPVFFRMGMSVYHSAYFVRIRDCLKQQFPTLFVIFSEQGFDEVVAQFLTDVKPMGPAIDVLGESFYGFLDTADWSWDFGVEKNVLAEIAAVEWSLSRVFDAPDAPPPLNAHILREIPPADFERLSLDFVPSLSILRASVDALAAVEQVERGELPAKPKSLTTCYLFYRSALRVQRLRLSDKEFHLIAGFKAGKDFKALIQSHEIESSVHLIYGWFQKQIVAGIKLL